jgi:hypothetical protein
MLAVTPTGVTALLYVSVMNRPSTCASECALAHVVNNKLGIITATCDLLLERATDPAVVAWLRVIETAAKALADEFNKPLSRTQGA